MLPVLVDVLLGDGERIINRQKVAKQARVYPTVESVELLGSVGGGLDKLPILLVGQRAALPGQMLVLQVAHQPLEVAVAAAGQGVVELDALLGHVNDGGGPVHVRDIYRKKDLVQTKKILPGHVEAPLLHIFVVVSAGLAK